jgi:hypothetical protein
MCHQLADHAELRHRYPLVASSLFS